MYSREFKHESETWEVTEGEMHESTVISAFL